MLTPTYSWTVDLMEYYPEHEDKEKVVFAVHWRCVAEVTEEDKTYNAIAADRQELLEITNLFIPYEKVKPIIALNWIWNLGVNKTEIESRLLAELEKRVANKAPLPEYFESLT